MSASPTSSSSSSCSHDHPAFFFLYSTTHPPVWWFLESQRLLQTSWKRESCPRWPNELKKGKPAGPNPRTGTKPSENAHFYPPGFFVVVFLKPLSARRGSGEHLLQQKTVSVYWECSRPKSPSKCTITLPSPPSKLLVVPWPCCCCCRW